jgi:hypothetical protein
MTAGDYIARCRAFSSGVMKDGLSATIAEYVRRVTLLADERLRARIGSDAGGHGFLLPKAAYNYTEDLGECGAAIQAGAAAGPLPADCHAAASYGEEEVTEVLPPPDVPNLELWAGDFAWDTDGVTPLDFNASELGARPYAIGGAVSSPTMQWLEEADKLYVTPGMFAAANVYANAALAGITAFNQFIVIFTAAFMGAYVLMMVFVFIPQVRATSADITSRRAMLLYLPAEIVSRQRAIKALVQSILAADSERAGFGVPSASLGGGGIGGAAAVGRMAAAARDGGGGGGMGGGGSDADGASAAARMSDEAGGLLTRTRSFHGEAPAKTRVTVADV